MLSRSILLLFVLSSVLLSCGGSGGGGSKSNQQEDDSGDSTDGSTTGGTTGSAARIIYDSDLSSREKAALDKGTSRMGSLKIDGSLVPKFSQVFGGNSSSNVVNYVETRVNYAFSASTNLDERIDLSKNKMLETIASNPSSIIWFYDVYYERTEGLKLTVRSNGGLIDVTSSRVGVMQFGDPFADFNSVEQSIFIVHEGRHSDCTGGVTADDLFSAISGGEMHDPRCGHAHRICPEGHPDAGAYACDEHAWGAYAVSAIYSFAISESCSNCSQTEKTLAESWGQVSARRLLYKYSDLLKGVYGSPNMNNSTTVR